MTLWKALAIVSLFLLLFTGSHSVPRRLDPEAPSNRLMTFIAVMSGSYSNIKQVRTQERFRDKIIQDIVNVTFRPVFVPAFQPALTIYFEETSGDTVFRMQVLVVTEDEEGVITCIPYNFTDPSLHKPHSFDVNKLADLSLDDFEVPPEDCYTRFMQIEEEVFMGTMPDCVSRDSDGVPPKYTEVFTCNTNSVVTSAAFSREQHSPVPYHDLQYRTYRLLPYMLDRAPPNFREPCRGV